MSIFRKSQPQQPSEAFAAEEQNRADGLARKIGEISATPGSALTGSLPHYQAAYQAACSNAAGHTAQPTAPRRRWGRN